MQRTSARGKRSVAQSAAAPDPALQVCSLDWEHRLQTIKSLGDSTATRQMCHRSAEAVADAQDTLRSAAAG